MTKDEMKELEALALPIRQWLTDKGYNPHNYVAIDQYDISLGETIMNIPNTTEEDE
ncbi:hypothetical protein VP5_053 [Vibrio virus VPMCC5]|nr:hypothetical protein VP5_053 [Vibrio virus VPMCC5]